MLRADHVAFRVDDLGRAIAFYTEKLGLGLMFKKVDEEHHEAFAYLALEGANIELLQVLDERNQPVVSPPRAVDPHHMPHLAIATDNLDETLRALKGKGVAIVKGPLEIPGMVRWMYVSDPDCNVIEYVQWLKAQM